MTTTTPAPSWPLSARMFTTLMHQGPVSSSVHSFSLESMRSMRPATRVGTPAEVGAAAPDFSIERTDGRTAGLADFAGRPLVLYLARAVTPTLVCPLCTPALTELNEIADDFEQAGVGLAVVFSIETAETAAIAADAGLRYPLWSDPSWDLFRAYGTGHGLYAPRQAWAVVDPDGVLRWTWRLSEAADGETLPLPSSVLAIARDLAT